MTDVIGPVHLLAVEPALRLLPAGMTVEIGADCVTRILPQAKP